MDSKNLVLFVGIIYLSFSGILIGDGAFTNDHKLLREITESSSSKTEGTKWAVLVAGSNGYWNYRHQADICHAYQIFKKGGLKDENIIVFMYDDIAYHTDNPRKGVIINHPNGKDNVYPGVPKDYTGDAVNSENLYAVILGNETAIKGGSGKVLNTTPNDQIFIYYADHGGPGLLGMPKDEDEVYAIDLVYVLMKKHASGHYKKMVIYVEACESGSIFDGLLPKNLNIYVSTASNPNESSYGTYCGDVIPNPPGYEGTCLGDVFSVSWMEDSDNCNPMSETLEEQYVAVKHRTATTKGESSHVMQYGDVKLSKDVLAVYLLGNSSTESYNGTTNETKLPFPLSAVDQRDTDLLYFANKVQSARDGSNEKADAQKVLDELIAHRKHVDQSIANIGKALFGEEDGPSMLNLVRPAGLALVDDWDCFKAMVKIYEEKCGFLKTYGKKYMRAFGNICNAGIPTDQMAEVSTQVCSSKKKFN